MAINKKGTQVSMILSFIIFVVSLLFVYFIAVASINKVETGRNFLVNVESNIMTHLYSDVWVLRGYDTNNSGGCVSILIPEVESGGETIAVGDSGGLTSSVSGTNVLVEGGSGFIKVYYSNMIKNENLLSNTSCVGIKLDSAKKERIIPAGNVLNLMILFSSSYETAKRNLEVPPSMELSLYFQYQNGTSFGTEIIPPNTNVYSDDMKLNYLSAEGVKEIGTLRVKIW